MIDKSKSVAFSDTFIWHYGAFHGSWSSMEVLLCYIIGKLLRLSHIETLVLTAGMEFGRKATLARNLAYRSNHKNKNSIVNLLGRIQNESKRNVFAHGMLLTDEERVIFVDRSRGGDFEVTAHSFTLPEFISHVQSVITMGGELHEAFETDESDLAEFNQTAMKEVSKTITSPVPPSPKP